jgi:hypothetical protein
MPARRRRLAPPQREHRDHEQDRNRRAPPPLGGGSIGRLAIQFSNQLAYLLSFVTRVIHYRNYGVYVNDARGEPHHRPHAHIQVRGRRIASVYLETLDYYWEVESVPKELKQLIANGQDDLLDTWEGLNS